MCPPPHVDDWCNALAAGEVCRIYRDAERISSERVRNIRDRPLPARCSRQYRAEETRGDAEFPGETAMIPPPTPLLAGNPVSYSHLPESSYRPAVAITARTHGTFAGSIACQPSRGFSRRTPASPPSRPGPRIDTDRALPCVEIDRLRPLLLMYP